MQYVLLVLAVIIGQTAKAAFSIWKHQSNNENIGYWTAAGLYLKKNIGAFIAVLSFTFVLLFVLSDWMDMTLTKQELASKAVRTKFEEAQLKFKTVAIVYGLFAQGIASLFFKAGEKAIKDYGKAKGIDVDTNNN